MLRERSGLTQSGAAKKMGIVRTTYSNYEAGNREPDNDTLKLFADFFEVTTDYLLGRTDNPSEVINDTYEGLSEWRKKAIEAIHKMSEEEVNYFYDLMKRITKE
jgi:transcriptional regulator with XRE-family HTH domain